MDPGFLCRVFVLYEGVHSNRNEHLATQLMLRLPSPKAQGPKDFWKQSKPCHVGMHWKALAEYSHMGTHLLGFQSFFSFFLHHFVLTKLATSSIRVKQY